MTRIRKFLAAAACAAVLAVAPATAQERSAQAMLAASRLAPDLSFPTEPASLGLFATPAMALYKPQGDGPFPALVLQHQCGGLQGRNWTNQSMLQWARDAVERGWVVLQIDSLGPRGVDTVCMGPKGGVNFFRGVRDALQAAGHLAALPFVDKDRIALAGFSWGAMNAVLGSSRAAGQALAAGGPRFAASVAMYPGCFTIRPPGGAAYEIARPDIDRPLLVLMGGQDTETPAAECLPRLEAAQAAGSPVRWHVYPDATHCFDCRNLHNFQKTDARGTQVVYRYDEAVTRDARARMFDFLDEALKLRR